MSVTIHLATFNGRPLYGLVNLKILFSTTARMKVSILCLKAMGQVKADTLLLLRNSRLTTAACWRTTIIGWPMRKIVLMLRLCVVRKP